MESNGKDPVNEYIYGRRNVGELLKKYSASSQNMAAKIESVFVKENPSPELRAIIKNLSIPVSYLPGRDLDKMIAGKNHQGIILALKKDKRQSLYAGGLGEFQNHVTENTGLVLLLDRIQDAGNLGNILRTAECLGVNCIVLPDRDSCDITDTVIRISSGAVHHLKIFKVSNLRHCCEFLKKNNYWILAADESGSGAWDIPDSENMALIMGNEKEGIKRILMEEADYISKIPLSGNVSSLNVSVATGIMIDRIKNRK